MGTADNIIGSRVRRFSRERVFFKGFFDKRNGKNRNTLCQINLNRTQPIGFPAPVFFWDGLLAGGPSLIVDAVDSLGPKAAIIHAGASLGVPVFSALGAATRLDAGAVDFGPLFAARGCPLGRQVRKRLRKRGLEGGDLWCVYSREDRNLEALREPEEDGDEYVRGRRRQVLGSLSTITGPGVCTPRIPKVNLLILGGAEEMRLRFS